MNWFHKEDGGLIKLYLDSSWAHCSICGELWDYLEFRRKEEVWVPFFDLPEDLQAVALEEML